MKRGHVFLALLALGAAALGFYLGRPGPSAAPPQDALLDRPAPAFSLPQVMRPEHTLSAGDFLGKVSLLNVWASWCVSCREEHPLLMELARQQEVAVYGLNYLDTLAEAQAFLKQHGNPYLASAFDDKGVTGAAYAIVATPVTYVIDKRGVIRYRHLGVLNPAYFDSIILPVIRQLQAET